MYKKKQLVEVPILDLGEKNQCYGRLEDGISIFVQGPAAVGDVVEASIFKIKKKYLVARMTRIITPSANREEPICPYFGLCGGCKWQHMNYTEQLRLKRKQVLDALEHIGGFENIECAPCLPAPACFGYRNKMDFSFTDLRYLSDIEVDLPEDEHDKPLDFALGFHAPGCYAKAIDIDRCDLASEETNRTLQLVRSFCLQHKDALPIYSTRSHTGELRNLVVRQGKNSGELMVNLVTSTHQPELMELLAQELEQEFGDKLTTFVNSTTSSKNTVAFSEKEYPLRGPGYISDQLGDYTYRISPNSFFQTNTAQAETLYNQILDCARLKPDDTVYDLFCGTGSIALFASGHCQKVLGVEVVESSVNDARANAELHGVTNCSFIQLDMKDVYTIKSDIDAFGLPDVIITDPPRAGMHPKAVKMLLELAPPAIIYVSCNPASLARDGQMLCESGTYTLVECRPVDMFPQTNHVESVARFERVDYKEKGKPE